MRAGIVSARAAAAQRALGATYWQVQRRADQDRQRRYGGRHGLRAVTFHHTGPVELAQLRRIVEFWRDHGGFATPADVDALVEGRWPEPARDRLLITFDDGLESNHVAARYLAGEGLSAIFFVVPSLVGRSTAEFHAYHDERGVRAFSPPEYANRRGLSATQVRELVAMGHRVGAHNFAHRSLRDVRAPEDLRYEIDRAVEGIAELTGSPCEDFAWAFGQPEDLPGAAAAHLTRLVPRVYACHRGLNVPGLTPAALLRHAVEPDHPWTFTRACLLGHGDRRVEDRAEVLATRVGTLPRTAERSAQRVA